MHCIQYSVCLYYLHDKRKVQVWINMPIGEKEHFGNCYVLTLLAEVFIISYFI